MSIINNLFKKKVGSNLLKNKDFSVSSESGGAAQKSGRTPAQSGRTMTEMLGTLAVIGVLSIGGIAGYNYAMDKYRANVTINDINLRAVDLVTQAGREANLNLAEWGQTSMAGYTFSNFGKTDDGMIFLEVSGIPKSVCNMMVDILVEQFDMDINGDRIDKTDECGLSDNNIITVYFEGGGAGVTCNPACGTEEICVNGICVDEETQPATIGGIPCSSNADCPECIACSANKCMNYSLLNGISCGINGEGTCKKGICLLNECSSNVECDTDKYCADLNSSCEETHPSYCAKIDFVSKTINGKTYYISNGWMSWWDARSICQKLGKEMVTLNELIVDWNGLDGYGHTLTEQGQALQSVVGGSFVWVDNYLNSSTSSCNAFYLYRYPGHVGSSPRTYYALALCH